MPKQEITQEMILDAALDMTREKGYESVNARSVAYFMKRSVQPIYSYFQNMDELKEALYTRAMAFYDGFIRSHADMMSLESMAAANIRFARQEPNLFRMLFLAKLSGNHSFSDIFERMSNKAAAHALAGELGVSDERAKEIYIMMIVFTHGIATMLATGGADVPDDEIDGLMREAYASFVERQINRSKEEK